MQTKKWRFCLDRGGTFTDIVALAPQGQLYMDKTPSDSISGGLQMVRRYLGLPPDALIPAAQVADIRIGTTISTNRLLERKGERPALLVTRGFADILRIGDQTRPYLFTLDIRRPSPLYDQVIEVDERLDASGKVVQPLDAVRLRAALKKLRRRADGLTIAFMHASQYPAHEQMAAALARELGFARVIASHEVSALMKYIPRAHTAVADAYLDAGLREYIRAIVSQCEAGVEILFMQSNGGLAAAETLRAVNTILSGPAGGAVGATKSAQQAGFTQAIGFDMGGTSTDVCISGADGAGLRLENTIAGTPLFVPMLDINTVAAGGGSVVHYRDGRLQVGPQSAGARPGPACYRQGGPLTITDCNVLLGKLQTDYFPAIFGARQNQTPDAGVVRDKFTALAEAVSLPAEQLAEEFIRIAVEQMAAAIRRLAVERAVDPRRYLLNSFGGAAGQHACLVAEAVGIGKVLVPRQASVLSAWGIGAADIATLKNRSIECALDAGQLPEIFAGLAAAACAELPSDRPPQLQYFLRCRYAGVDTQLPIVWRRGKAAAMRADFEKQHQARYGYVAADKTMLAAVAEVQAQVRQIPPPLAAATAYGSVARACSARRLVRFNGKMRRTGFYDWERLPPGARVAGPAVIYHAINTVVVEPRWQARLLAGGDILLEKTAAAGGRQRRSRAAMIEIMNNRFTFVAEQMGERLRQTAMSVNIRERLDFSCALFDGSGHLIANAPHIPVHLGSMSDSVRYLHRQRPPGWERGDTFLLNSPYHGGTHLPDLTVIRPGRLDGGAGAPDFYVAARGHHADIGGISPGSMPAVSRHIDEEGVLFELTPLVINGALAEAAILARLKGAVYPARSPHENIADLRAQIASVAGGISEMRRAGEEFGAATLRRYLRLVQNNADSAVRQVLADLQDGESRMTLDDGSAIMVSVHIDRSRRRAVFDFSGTSPQHAANFNAPAAVVRAAVIYCLRVLLGENIPLNDGLLRPVRLILPRGCMLNPRPPAAVAAGNVEVSQNIVDAVFAALGVCANAQGGCNNLTIGIGERQYYETIAGGMGASAQAAGADAVQVNMTNSRASDPEVLEWNYPLRLEAFSIRRGSGGRGRHAGGCGVARRLRLLAAGEVNLLTSRRVQPPLGLAGGENGRCGNNYAEYKNGKRKPLQGCDRIILQAGDCIVIETPGGGGFGEAEKG